MANTDITSLLTVPTHSYRRCFAYFSSRFSFHQIAIFLTTLLSSPSNPSKYSSIYVLFFTSLLIIPTFSFATTIPPGCPTFQHSSLADLQDTHGEFSETIKFGFNNIGFTVTNFVMHMQVCGVVANASGGCENAMICVTDNTNSSYRAAILTLDDLAVADWGANNVPTSQTFQATNIRVPPSTHRPIPLPNSTLPEFRKILVNRHSSMRNFVDSLSLPPTFIPPSSSGSPPTSGLPPPMSGPPRSNISYQWPLPLCTLPATTVLDIRFVCSNRYNFSITVVADAATCAYTILLENPISCDDKPTPPKNDQTSSSTYSINIIVAICICCAIGLAILYILGGYIALRYACKRRGTAAYSHLLCVKSLEECCCGLDLSVYSSEPQPATNEGNFSRQSLNSGATATTSNRHLAIQSFRTESSSLPLPESPESVTRTSIADARAATAASSPSLLPRTTEMLNLGYKPTM